jgi:hypothetical protein
LNNQKLVNYHRPGIKDFDKELKLDDTTDENIKFLQEVGTKLFE